MLLASNLPRLPEMCSGGLGQLSNRWDREQSTRVGNERGSWPRNSKLQLLVSYQRSALKPFFKKTVQNVIDIFVCVNLHDETIT